MTLTWGDIVALLVGLFGGGTGLAALYRARAQNRVDERKQLSEEQVLFRQSMAEQLSALRTQLLEVEKRNDVLETETRDQGKQLAALQTKNEYQEQRIQEQAEQIAGLRQQNATQAAQIAALTEEKAGVVQRLQVETAQRQFLERENGDLRRELDRLRTKLPNRVDLSDEET
jgi:chromosome segregation ATPase